MRDVRSREVSAGPHMYAASCLNEGQSADTPHPSRSTGLSFCAAQQKVAENASVLVGEPISGPSKPHYGNVLPFFLGNAEFGRGCFSYHAEKKPASNDTYSIDGGSDHAFDSNASSDSMLTRTDWTAATNSKVSRDGQPAAMGKSASCETFASRRFPSKFASELCARVGDTHVSLTKEN